jgi:hypothetical protein
MVVMSFPKLCTIVMTSEFNYDYFTATNPNLLSNVILLLQNCYLS